MELAPVAEGRTEHFTRTIDSTAIRIKGGAAPFINLRVVHSNKLKLCFRRTWWKPCINSRQPSSWKNVCLWIGVWMSGTMCSNDFSTFVLVAQLLDFLNTCVSQIHFPYV